MCMFMCICVCVRVYIHIYSSARCSWLFRRMARMACCLDI